MYFLFRVPVAAVIFKRWIVVDVLWFEERTYYLFLIKIQQVNCVTRLYTAWAMLFFLEQSYAIEELIVQAKST